MRADRLLRLARHLETVVAKQPETFDLQFWARRTGPCGFAACAVGHGCSIPEFAAAGLRLAWPVGATNPAPRADVAFGGDTGSLAVAEFFGIDCGDVDYLFTLEEYLGDPLWAPFNPGRDPTAADVAARIRAYVGAWNSTGAGG